MAVIDWDGFTWDAFATLAGGVMTLAAGAAAVGAAAVVGIRQERIASKQVDILARQVGLEEMTLRADLFDRRFRIYEATLDFLSEIARRGDVAHHETDRAFVEALNQSRLLFRPDVHAALKRIWDDYCQYGLVKRTMKANYERSGGDYGTAEVQAEYDYTIKLGELLKDLPALFGDALLLGGG
jgi:hypothetical protein